MYKEHSLFNPPPSGAALWRYLDFTKFVSLLDKCALFFARADKLGDPFEGSYPKANVDMRFGMSEELFPEKAVQEVSHFLRESRRFTLVNCWYWSEYESAAMWRMYSREHDGIAVKTDFGSLSESFVGNEVIYIGRVSYIDYKEDFIRESNIFAPYLNKRKSFEHENEVRAINQDFPIGNGRVDLSQNICDVGTYFDVDLSLLVKEVVVAPFAEDWFLKLVQSVTNLYNLDVPVRKSDLADTPTWGRSDDPPNELD